MVRETRTAATTTVDDKQEVGDGLHVELLVPEDLLVHGDGLLHEGDGHVAMPEGNSCLSEIGKVRGAQLRA